MFRILFFVFLVFVVWLAVRMLGGSRKRAGPAAAPTGAPTSVEQITQCAWCGVHVPRGDAVTLADGRIYCSLAHRDAAEVAVPVDRSSR